MSKIIIGITGKSGSGKSTLAAELGKSIPNSTVINVDDLGHEALCQPEILKELKERFGNKILDETGAIDRKKLGNIVFIERNKMKQLTNISFVYITKKIKDILETKDGILIFDWILLPQNLIWNKCDVKILVNSTNIQSRKEKVIIRDNISEEYFEAREKENMEYDKEQFNYIFYNDYTKDAINKMVDSIQSYLSSLNKIDYHNRKERINYKINNIKRSIN